MCKELVGGSASEVHLISCIYLYINIYLTYIILLGKVIIKSFINDIEYITLNQC